MFGSETDKALPEECLLVEARLELRHVAHGEVHLTGFESPGAVLRDPLGVDGNSGCQMPISLISAGKTTISLISVMQMWNCRFAVRGSKRSARLPAADKCTRQAAMSGWMRVA